MIATRTRDTAVVIGGTGFLGRRVVPALQKKGFTVRVATRFPDKPARPGDDRIDFEVVQSDLRNTGTLQRAFQGAAVVVNCIGLYVETRADSFRDVHVAGARNVALAANSAGVSRLIHISGIGATRNSHSAYIRAPGGGRGCFSVERSTKRETPLISCCLSDVIVEQPPGSLPKHSPQTGSQTKSS